MIRPRLMGDGRRAARELFGHVVAVIVVLVLLLLEGVLLSKTVDLVRKYDLAPAARARTRSGVSAARAAPAVEPRPRAVPRTSSMPAAVSTERVPESPCRSQQAGP